MPYIGHDGKMVSYFPVEASAYCLLRVLYMLLDRSFTIDYLSTLDFVERQGYK